MAKVNSNLDCARLLKILGEPKRLAILRLLFLKPLCVQEIEQTLSLPQYEVSRHLGVLRRAGLLQAKRDAQRTYYGVHPDVRLDEKALEFGCCRVEFRTETTNSTKDIQN